MAHMVLTAHARLAPAQAEAGVLAWLEELGLEVALGEADHLLAFDAGTQEGALASVDFYPLDGGLATQVRLQVSRSGSGEEPRADGLAVELRRLVEADPHWVLDGLDSRDARAGI
jgi:hypothetical protein